MTPIRQSVSTRITLILGLLLAALLSAGYVWLTTRGETLIAREEVENTQLTAEALTVSLKSIMLAGRGDIAHDWLRRVARLQDVESARVYRVDGVEAFVDLKTIRAVNKWNSKVHFHRNPGARKPAHVPPGIAARFRAVARDEAGQLSIKDDRYLTFLYPIKVEDACLRCHGYTDNPLRGVLALRVSTAAIEGRLRSDFNQAGVLFAGIAALLMLGAWVSMQRQMVSPLSKLTKTAGKILDGDLSQRLKLERKDEFGVVATAFDKLVTHLKDRIAWEHGQRRRQEALTKAVIHLAEKSASEEILRHVGRLAMDMTGARYAMLGYRDRNDKKHFIPFGLSPDEEKKIAHSPQGEGSLGLLDLLWKDRQTVRIDDISAHPASAGFPPGHPAMTTFLGTSITFEDQMMGVIYLTDRKDGQPFSEEDEAALRVLAAACAVALSNARNMESELMNINRRLRNREMELELMNENLASANEAKNQFLANTSHELRTPLNAIIGFSELLGNPQLGTLTDKQKRYVDHVHVSGKRLLHIINDLLDISKIEAGMMDIEETRCVPAEIARQTVDSLKPLAEAKKIHLMLREDTGANASIVADAGKLHQMLVNLTGNAIKFTPEGGEVVVSIRVEAHAGNECRIIAEVKDTGIGIDEGDQERIFKPFVQARGGLGREHGGTGLGLALTRRQVNLLGGDLSLESRPGAGSRFTIGIPARRATEAEEKAKSISPEIGTIFPVGITEIVPEQGPQPRILVADENRERGKSVVRMMEQEGYDTMLADIAQTAQSAAHFCPFLIMLGIPEQGGATYSYLQMLKTHGSTRDLPIILIGGKADNPEFSMGTIGIMEKGISQQEILDVIAHHGQHAPSNPEIPTVLVVDDDASVREFLKETLVTEGHRTLLAASGEEGIRIAIDREPDLIILDLMMPDVTGFDVLNRLRKHPATADIPIVIYTAKDLSREEALHLGRDAERVLLKGADGRVEILRQLHKLELVYPVQAHLVDATLRCFNHRYLLRRLEQETSNAIRHGQKFSLIGWQMDGYGDYIREHGERWGVTALKDMVETVKSVTRRSDVCTRIAEARFVLFLPNITSVGAIRVAEKLRIRLRHQRFPLPRDEFGSFTASFGAVHFGDDTEDVGALLKTLTKRINEAASGGGNKIMLGET